MATIQEVKAAKRIYEDEKKLAEQKVQDAIAIHREVLEKVKELLPSIKDELEEVYSLGRECGSYNYLTSERDRFSIRFDNDGAHVYFVRANCRNEQVVYSPEYGFTEDEYLLMEFVSLWATMKEEAFSLIKRWYENLTKGMVEQATKRYADEVNYQEKIAAL